MENEVVFIKLDDIIPNRFQPREVFDEEALSKLADSIRQHGVIEPILVRPVSNKYEIIAGERRYKASVLAGLTKIPALVKQMDDKESSIIAYVENEHRSDVSAIEESRTIDRILKNNDMTQEELAKELGINQSTLANKLRLLSLPMEVQDALLHNEISERHARSLLTIKDVAKQIELLSKIKEKKMSVRELDSEIKNMNENVENKYISDEVINKPQTEQNNESNEGFTDYLNNYDNNNPIEKEQEDDSGFMDYLNNYDNSKPVSRDPQEDSSFMDYLNNYDSNNPVPEEPQEEDTGFMDYLNNYDNNSGIAEVSQNESSAQTINEDETYLNENYSKEKDNSVLINDVNPPITSRFDINSYVENNPDFVDVSKNIVISDVDEIIEKLKTVIDDIKSKSKFKIDTDEIDFDDIYQITIKIDKKDF